MNDFLLNKLSVKETFEFFKLLVFPYDRKKEDVDAAFSFDEGIYEYCLVLSFKHVERFFERTANESDQGILHDMFFMMVMIHERSFATRPLKLRSAETLLETAVDNIENLFSEAIASNSYASSSFKEIFLFIKLAQFASFADSPKEEQLLDAFIRIVGKLNTAIVDARLTVTAHLSDTTLVNA